MKTTIHTVTILDKEINLNELKKPTIELIKSSGYGLLGGYAAGLLFSNNPLYFGMKCGMITFVSGLTFKGLELAINQYNQKTIEYTRKHKQRSTQIIDINDSSVATFALVGLTIAITTVICTGSFSRTSFSQTALLSSLPASLAQAFCASITADVKISHENKNDENIENKKERELIEQEGFSKDQEEHSPVVEDLQTEEETVFPDETNKS